MMWSFNRWRQASLTQCSPAIGLVVPGNILTVYRSGTASHTCAGSKDVRSDDLRRGRKAIDALTFQLDQCVRQFRGKSWRPASVSRLVAPPAAWGPSLFLESIL